MPAINIFVVLAALTVSVASFAASSAPPSTLRLGECLSTSPRLPFVAAPMQLNPAYQAIYGTMPVISLVVPASLIPLLQPSNATCGAEEEAAEVANWFGTCLMLPLKRMEVTMVANPTWLAIYGPRPVKGPVFLLDALALVQPVSQPEAMQLVVFHGADFVLLPTVVELTPDKLPPSDWMQFFRVNDSRRKVRYTRRVIPQGQRAYYWIALCGLTVLQAVLVKGVVCKEKKKAAKKGGRKAAAAPKAKAAPFSDLGETAVGGLLGEEVKGTEAVPPFFKTYDFNLASTFVGAAFGQDAEGVMARPPFYDFVFDNLADTFVGAFFGEEVEGVDVVPPFKQLVVIKKANKGIWTLSSILGVVLPARRSRGSQSFRGSVGMAASTAAAVKIGSDDRGRSESVLPREVMSRSINVDGAGVLCQAEEEKESTHGSKVAGFRAAVKRIFKGSKQSSSRAAASSVCEMVTM